MTQGSCCHLEGAIEAQQFFVRLDDAFKGEPMADLFSDLGKELEFQTKTRITREKTDPGGTAWTPWSSKYARRQAKRPGASLLINTRNLLGKIFSSSDRNSASVSAAVSYAKYVNGLRRFLGLSSRNRADLLFLARWRLRELVQKAMVK